MEMERLLYGEVSHRHGYLCLIFMLWFAFSVELSYRKSRVNFSF